MNILSKFKNIKNEISKGIRDFYSYFINSLIDASKKCKDLRKTNIELADFHLTNANFNDAIFRYLILIRFFKLESERIFYNLGLAYYLNNSKTKALDFFKKSLKLNPMNKLCEFRINSIENPDSITAVPLEIVREDFDILAKIYGKLVIKSKFSAPELLVKELVEFITRQEDIDKYKCKAAIDIGCGYGVGGYLAKVSINIDELYGIDLSPIMIEVAKKFNDKEHTFNELYNGDYLKFDQYEGKFDLVIACYCLQFTKDLKPFFKKFKHFSHKDAYLAFAVPHSKFRKTCYNENTRQFEYTIEDLKKMLEAEKFHKFKISNLEVSNNSEALLVVAKK